MNKETYEEIRDAGLETFSKFRPTPHDQAGLGSSEEDADWIVAPVSITRDSGLLATSNWEVAIKDLDRLEEAGELEYEIHRFGHWGPGWFEIAIVKPNEAGIRWCVETACALASYPILDESDHSEREWSAIWEWWESDAFRDWLRAAPCSEEIADLIHDAPGAADMCLRFCQRSEYGHEEGGEIRIPFEPISRDALALLARLARLEILEDCDPYVLVPVLYELSEGEHEPRRFYV